MTNHCKLCRNDLTQEDETVDIGWAHGPVHKGCHELYDERGMKGKCKKCGKQMEPDEDGDYDYSECDDCDRTACTLVIYRGYPNERSLGG